ncbi:MAG: hypothetical protein HKO95_11030 [Rhodobacteraceae bacterium]|jgi:hypothetical protein|nr:hypothetical protein [Paracoccaceae bacterium]
MKTHATGIALIALTLWCGPAMAQTAPSDCVLALLAQRDARFATLQDQIADVVARAHPELREVADAAAEAQVAMRATSTRRLIHLIGTRPALLGPSQTLHGLANLALSEEELVGLRAADPGFAAIEAKREAALARSAAMPGMDRLREAVAEAVQDPEGLAPVLEEFASANAMLERDYVACFDEG